MKKYLSIPKVQIVVILFLFFLLQASLLGIQIAFSLFALCVGLTVFFDIVFTYLRRKVVFDKPFAAIVTGLILTLIIDPSATWYQIALIAAGAMATKNFLRVSRHIFNPAASGLFFGWVFFKLNPSWWAATLHRGDTAQIFNIALYIVLFLIALVSLRRLGKYGAVVTYVVLYGLLSIVFFSSSPASVLQTAIAPGVLFYALLMLPEPMTSPVKKLRQVLYGAFVAGMQMLLIVVSTKFAFANPPDFTIIALLLGNLLFFKYR